MTVTPMSPSIRSKLHFFAAGAVIEAIDKCKSGHIERAFCAVRPPGHHAEADKAMGFCIFNNIAVGARYAQKSDTGECSSSISMSITETVPSISSKKTTPCSTSALTSIPLSGNRERLRAGTRKGEGCTYNFPMPFGSGDKEFYEAYRISFRDS